MAGRGQRLRSPMKGTPAATTAGLVAVGVATGGTVFLIAGGAALVGAIIVGQIGREWAVDSYHLATTR
jgi:hypothetical protein